MKILLLNQFFWPDSSATSQILASVARGLAAEGNEVYAICAEGVYAPANSGQAPPVQVHYVKALPFVRGKLGRLLSYGSFYIAAAWRALTMPKVDLVITLTTPPLLSLLGSAIKGLRGSRHFIWEMDMYPDVAVDCGYFEAGGVADRITGALADWSRLRSDGIIALGECMRDRLIARGTPAEKIFIAHNWADSTAISVLPFRGESGRLTLLYSGNLGLAHDLETISGAMRNLREDSRFRFIFAGGGVRREELSKFAAAEKIESIEFRAYVDHNDLGESLAVGDIGLVTQRDACCGSVVPSKVYGLLAAGRPILFVGPTNATPARIIREFSCGWHIPCGNIGQLTELLLHLIDHPEEVREAGQRGYRALLEKFDLPLGVARIAKIIGANRQTPVSQHLAAIQTRSQHSPVSS